MASRSTGYDAVMRTLVSSLCPVESSAEAAADLEADTIQLLGFRLTQLITAASSF